MTLEENLKAIESVIDYVKGCGPAAEQAIEAIREMQAELAGREEAPAKEVELCGWTEEREAEAYARIDRACCADLDDAIKEITYSAMMDLPDAIREIKRLKEELRTVKASWEFQGGERIIADRDKLLKKNNALCDDLDAARNDERRVSGERDSLRDKLRAAEEARDKADGEVERLLEELRIAKSSWKFEDAERIMADLVAAQGLACDRRSKREVAIAEARGLRDKLEATEKAMGKAEGEVERLHERVTKAGILYDEAKDGLGQLTHKEMDMLDD